MNRWHFPDGQLRVQLAEASSADLIAWLVSGPASPLPAGASLPNEREEDARLGVPARLRPVPYQGRPSRRGDTGQPGRVTGWTRWAEHFM
jgi:hypothetical protein